MNRIPPAFGHPPLGKGGFIHGHVHRDYGANIPQRCTYGDTTVINAYDYCIIEIPDGEIRK